MEVDRLPLPMSADEHSTQGLRSVSNTGGVTLQRARGFLAILGVGLVATPAALAGQVGHAPDASPYRPVLARQVASGFGGYMFGDAGKAGVGPHDGPLVGARYEFLFGGPVALDLRLAVADLDRVVIDPTRVPEQRIKGTFDQQVLMTDVGINLVLTGPKTWHGLAPFVGGALGLAFGNGVPQDSSTFDFNVHFMVAPQGGVRWHIGNRFLVRLEGRDTIWRLSYPDLFFEPPVADPDGDPVLNPETSSDTDWTHHLVLTLSLGFALRL